MTAIKSDVPRNSGIVLALLLLAYIFNFLDRQILGILAGPIIVDLKLTDAEFGAIAGLAFAILYSVLGVPLGLLADRTSRSRVVAGSLVVVIALVAVISTVAVISGVVGVSTGVAVVVGAASSTVIVTLPVQPAMAPAIAAHVTR